jgi:tetratricopeptide (TPR) repeat protein
MAKQKKKGKIGAQVPVHELVKTAEEQLLRGETDKALHNLRRAEPQLKPRLAPDGKKITVPPHIVAAQAAFPALLARALFEHSFKLANLKQRQTALEEAARLAPAETRYRLALGVCRLLTGDTAGAYADFQKADEMRPNDPAITRAFALGLLATARAREATGVLGSWPRENRDETWYRLNALCNLAEGNAEIASLISGNLKSPFASPLLKSLSNLAAGDTAAAQATLDQLPAIDHNPTQAEAAMLAMQLYYSGLVNFAAGRDREAFGNLREASSLARSHSLPLPSPARLAASLHAIAERSFTADAALANDCWQEALKLDPTDKVAQSNLRIASRAQALDAWRAGQTEAAIALWQEALETGAQDERLLRNLAVALEKLERKDEAVIHWRALARLWRQQAKQRASEPGFKDRLLRLEQHLVGLMIETRQDEHEIINELEAAIKLDPDNHELRLQIAEQHLAFGKPHLAVRQLQMVERAQGESADLLARKALALAVSQNRKEAEKTYERAIELEPDNKPVKIGYLTYLGGQAVKADENDDIERAVEICQKQLSVDPNYAPALKHLATLYFDLDKDDEADKLLNRLIETNPQSWQQRVIVGGVYLDFYKNKEAEAHFQKALEIDSSAECHYSIGREYLDANENKKAIKYFDQAAEKAGVDLLLEMAIQLFSNGLTKDGMRFLDKAMKVNPADPEPHIVKALALAGGPLALILGVPSPKKRAQVEKELDEAERLASEHKEFASALSRIKEIRNSLSQTRSLLGGLPFGLPGLDFDEEYDEDDDEFDEGPPLPPIFSLPKKKKKKRK